MTETATKTQDSRQAIAVGRKDLPLSCPRPQDEVWNMHPRVYLPLEQSGAAVCPYCGAHYRLAD
ncbi:zinc-finger domain-containing protein [Candidatus Thiosymbion oneisti]|uniref:zinc-finger domain-containing protein n=1 Tax=Candidatus Thiosymbion oneisti TaxID=589554 RepID=UPI001060678B|nr:zinc-finger domain-containing protein [Candidatus Thiosymbion oneisti]